MSDDEFISYDDSDSGVSYSPEPDHEDEDDYIGKELIFCLSSKKQDRRYSDPKARNG